MAITVNKVEFVNRCEEVYRRNQVALENEHYGKVVALYEEGIAGMGDTTDTAYREAVKRYPEIFYFRRIGDFPAADFIL